MLALGLITSTPSSKANNPLSKVMWFFHDFPAHKMSPPPPVAKKRKTHIVQCCFLEPFVTFRNYIFFIKDNERLIRLKDLPFFWSTVILHSLCGVFHFVHVFCTKNARHEYLLHQNSSILCHFCLLCLLAWFTMPCGPIVPNPTCHCGKQESANWECMSQCHHSNVGPWANHLHLHLSPSNCTGCVVFPQPSHPP